MYSTYNTPIKYCRLRLIGPNAPGNIIYEVVIHSSAKMPLTLGGNGGKGRAAREKSSRKCTGSGDKGESKPELR